MNQNFINALERKSITEIKKIPKGDLHNHAMAGGKRNLYENLFKIKIDSPPYFNSIEELDNWLDENLSPLIKFQNGFERSLEFAFIQAVNDGVTKLEADIDLLIVRRYNNNIDLLISRVDSIYEKYKEHIEFVPIVGLNRDNNIEDIKSCFEQIIDYRYFKGIDLYGDEFSQPIQRFKQLYRHAKSKGMLLKAHVGEFGDSDSIKEAVEELELEHVQHGISAASSISLMQWLSDNNIKLNICPSSNLFLKRVPNLKHHPIKILFDNGIQVTVNTDDVFVFDQGVSDEFLNLYLSKVFSAYELDSIRRNGL